MNFIKKVKEKLKRVGIRLTAVGTAIATLGTGSTNFVLNRENIKEHEKIIENESYLNLNEDLENINVEIGNHIYTTQDEITAVTKEVEQEIYNASQKNTKPEKVKLNEKRTGVDIGDYNGVSLEDALRLAGYDISVEYRKELAKQYGIKDYNTSAEKNTELLNALKNEAKLIKTEQKNKEKDKKETSKESNKKNKKKKEKHTHKYELISQKYRINDNGTHTIIKKMKCSDKSCKKVKTVKKTYKHKFTKFQAFDDEYEKAKCECGAEKIRKHKYSEWVEDKNGITESRICKTCGHKMTRIKAKLLEELVEGVDYIKTVNYKDNGDGTHSIETKYKWIKSSGSLTIITKSSHDNEKWESLNDEQEINRCVCGYSQTRPHDFGEAKDNGDGTETLICQNCSHTITREKQQTISPISPTPIYPSPGPSEPDYNKPSHNHEYVLKDTKYEINQEKHTKILTYVCKKDNSIKVEKVEEIHKRANWKALNDEKEISECECGFKEYRNHKYSKWTPNPDGKTESRICLNCGHVMTREIKKEHECTWIKDGEIYYEVAEDGHIAKQNYRCSDPTCTKTKTEIIAKGKHTVSNWTPNTDGKTESGKCDECGAIVTREIEKEHECSWIEDGEVYYEVAEDGHIAKQNYRCSDPTCTKTKTEIIAKGKHTDNVTYNTDATKEIHTCTECGDIREKDHIHMLDYVGQEFTGDPTNDYCKVPVGKCACGKKEVMEDLLASNPAYGTLHNWKESTGRCEYCWAKKPEKEHECSWIEDGEVYYEVAEDGHIAKQNYRCSDPTCTKTKTEIIAKGKHTDNVTYNTDATKEIHTCTECGDIREKDHIHMLDYVGQEFTGDPTNDYCKVPVGKCACGKKEVMEDLLASNPAYGTLHNWKESTGRCEYCWQKNPNKEENNTNKMDPVAVTPNIIGTDESIHTTTGSAIIANTDESSIPEGIKISIVDGQIDFNNITQTKDMDQAMNIEQAVDEYLNSLSNYDSDLYEEENIRRK